jgi:hypothetical protein
MTLSDSLQQLALCRNNVGDLNSVILGQNEFYVLGLVNNGLVDNSVSRQQLYYF